MSNQLEFLQSTDATLWAAAFVERAKADPAFATDESTMIGWFANAIMRGYDEARLTKEREEAASTPTRAATDDTLSELLAEFRKNAEEWGAGNGDVWLERLTESEEKIERYVARLASSPSSTTATPGWNAEGECVECGVPFCKHWPERPSSRALSEEEQNDLAFARRELGALHGDSDA